MLLTFFTIFNLPVATDRAELAVLGATAVGLSVIGAKIAFFALLNLAVATDRLGLLAILVASRARLAVIRAKVACQ